MRTKNADGSITEDCPKCGGSTFIRNVDTNRSDSCENCKGTGQIAVAPAGHVVTDESPVVVVEAKPFGGGNPAPIPAPDFKVEVVDVTTANATEGETPEVVAKAAK